MQESIIAEEIKQLIDKIDDDDHSNLDKGSDSEENEDFDEEEKSEHHKTDGTTHYWRDWGRSIHEEVIAVVSKEEGDRDNPRICPQICTRLMKKIETIPLWGNVCRNSFGYGRVPASSASVEGEFNLVKTFIL